MASVYKRSWFGQDGRERVRWVAAYKDQDGGRRNKGFRTRGRSGDAGHPEDPAEMAQKPTRKLGFVRFSDSAVAGIYGFPPIRADPQTAETNKINILFLGTAFAQSYLVNWLTARN